jgi:hypothetical protein
MTRPPFPRPLPFPPEQAQPTIEDILSHHFGIPPVVLRILGLARAPGPCMCGQCPGVIVELTTRFHLPHGVIQPLIPGVRTSPKPEQNGEADIGVREVKVEP